MIPTNKDGETGVIDYSGRLLITDNIRHELSLGNAYRFGHHFKSVADETSVYVLFDPSNNGLSPERVYKMKATIQAISYPITMKFYEEPTVSANGTEIVIYNFNRNDECDSSLNSHAKMYYGPTVDASGNTYAPDVYVYADTSAPGLNLSTPGDRADEFSVYLNPNKKYLWEFENASTGTTDILVSGRIIYEQNYRAGGR